MNPTSGVERRSNVPLSEEEDEAGKQLKTSIDALKRDPKTVERLARETLGYAKPGETVIRFEEPSTNNTAASR